MDGTIVNGTDRVLQRKYVGPFYVLLDDTYLTILYSCALVYYNTIEYFPNR